MVGPGPPFWKDDRYHRRAYFSSLVILVGPLRALSLPRARVGAFEPSGGMTSPYVSGCLGSDTSDVTGRQTNNLVRSGPDRDDRGPLKRAVGREGGAYPWHRRSRNEGRKLKASMKLAVSWTGFLIDRPRLNINLSSPRGRSGIGFRPNGRI